MKGAALSRALKFKPASEHLPLGSEIKPQSKLNRARLVALRIDRPVRAIAEVSVRIAEIGAVEDIATLGIETHLQLVTYSEDLKQADIFVIGWETANRTIGAGRIAEGIGTRIHPGGFIEVIHAVRVKEAAVRGDRVGAFNPIRPLLAVEDQASQVIVHKDVVRPAALIAQRS